MGGGGREMNLEKGVPGSERLHALFHAITKGRDAMNFHQFMEATQCRSQLFATRLFQMIDSNGSGDITFEEFESAMSLLRSEDASARLSFAFHIFDLDGNGFITDTELVALLKASAQESDAALPPGDVDDLANALKGLFPKDRHGRITLEAFTHVMESYPDVVEGLSMECRSESPGARLLSKWRPGSYSGRLSRWLGASRKQALALGLTLILIAACFYWRFYRYAGDCDGVSLDKADPVSHLTRRQVMRVAVDGGHPEAASQAKFWAFSAEMSHLDPIECRDARKRELLGWTLPIAKGAAQAMKVVFTLILLPVSRNLMTTLRVTFLKSVFDFDKAVRFHKVLGRLGFALAWLHALCHVVDIFRWQDSDRFERWSWAFPDDDVEGSGRRGDDRSLELLRNFLYQEGGVVLSKKGHQPNHERNHHEFFGHHDDDDDDGLGFSVRDLKLRDDLANETLRAALEQPDGHMNGVPLYLFRDRSSQPTALELIKSPFGLSGIALIVIYTVAALFALDYPKKLSIFKQRPGDLEDGCNPLRRAVLFVGRALNNFNYFWYTHQLFAVFYIFLILHPLPHIPNERNEFGWSDTWVWIAVPMIIYSTERILRCKRSKANTKVIAADVLPGQVVGLKVLRPRGFRYLSGQYVCINCPQISPFEWHPFTLTSCPSDELLTVHIRSDGDWTESLYKLALEHAKNSSALEPGPSRLHNNSRSHSKRRWRQHFDSADEHGNVRCSKKSLTAAEDCCIEHQEDAASTSKEGATRITIVEETTDDCPTEASGIVPPQFPFQILVDGPFGAPIQKYIDYQVIVLIGAGIGATPMASVLNDILHRMHTYKCRRCGLVNVDVPSFKVKKVHFFWTVRTRSEAVWFKHVLEGIAQADEQNILDINIYFTSIRNGNDVRVMLLRLAQQELLEQTGQDRLSKLKSNRIITHFGRPDWDDVFCKIKEEYSNQQAIGVFYCGPNSLAKFLKMECKKQSDHIAKFDFVKEIF